MDRVCCDDEDGLDYFLCIVLTESVFTFVLLGVFNIDTTNIHEYIIIPKSHMSHDKNGV